MSSSQRLTTTSYAILGLLAVRSWSTYELTRQMEWSLGRFWPRAKSKLYEEPKKLEALGLGDVPDGDGGQAARAVYTITAKGRRALAAWQAEPIGRASRWRRNHCCDSSSPTREPATTRWRRWRGAGPGQRSATRAT